MSTRASTNNVEAGHTAGRSELTTTTTAEYCSPLSSWEDENQKLPESRGRAEEVALPQRYGTDRIILMLQDPSTLYCYWELTPQTIGSGQCPPAPGEMFLLRLQPEAAESIAVEVLGAVGSSYVNLLTGGGTYFAELGLRAADGSFIPLLRSNTVVLPPLGVSDVEDERWLGTAAQRPQFSPDSNGLPDLLMQPPFADLLSSYELFSASLVEIK